MTINFTSLHNQSHLLSDGLVEINQAFTGNVLSVQITARPNLPLGIPLGYIYQYKADAIASYALYSQSDVIDLSLPETDKVVFIPTSYLLSEYTLNLEYATVGNVLTNSNATPLPEIITALPLRVSSLESVSVDHSSRLDTLESESGNNSTTTWDSLTGKPTSFTPATHNHVKADITDLSFNWTDITDKPVSFPPDTHNHTINDVINLSSSLSTIGTRLTALESNPAASSNNLILLSTNTQLESNKSYLATVNNLVCNLPINPAIGDTVTLANGNFASFRVNHGNSSQSILNNSTQTTAGSTESGIILKAYGAISLVFIGSNLWVNLSKYRTINNWLSAALDDTVAIQKSYTATAFQAYSYNSNYNFSFVNDGNTNVGVSATSLNATNGLAMIATFPAPTIITGFQCFGGQWNGFYNQPLNCQIYRGNLIDTNNRVYNGSIPNATQVNLSPEPSTASTQWVIQFTNGSADVSVNEFIIFGKTSQGGEISVI